MSWSESDWTGLGLGLGCAALGSASGSLWCVEDERAATPGAVAGWSERGLGKGMTRGKEEMGSKDIFENTGELPRTGLGELRPEEFVLPAGGCSSSPGKNIEHL